MSSAHQGGEKAEIMVVTVSSNTSAATMGSDCKKSILLWFHHFVQEVVHVQFYVSSAILSDLYKFQKHRLVQVFYSGDPGFDA
jgi:hypothetical protein